VSLDRVDVAPPRVMSLLFTILVLLLLYVDVSLALSRGIYGQENFYSFGIKNIPIP
jgi:hypothetical protein